jgi:hypothetical protein
MPSHDDPLDPDAADLDADARIRLLATADRLMAGEWEALGVTRTDMDPIPDWFLDPSSGTRAPSTGIAFDINQRSRAVVGDAKQVWELSRQHHLTVLAAAYFVTRDEKYAERIQEQLESWWAANPFLRGIHWTSGIELGMRLIAWTWIHRLLAGWPGRRALFAGNELFLNQLYGHQQYLERLPSRGSSANNHLIAESAGSFIAGCAFPYFDQSADWRTSAAERLRRAISDQTYASGMNRELATEYHGFVLELALLAGLEGEQARHSLGGDYWRHVTAMGDALVATLDVAQQPPRQGDGDDAVALLVDGAIFDRWTSLVATCTAVLGPTPWWPDPAPTDVRTWLLAGRPARPEQQSHRRPAMRPLQEPEAGMTILLADEAARDEIWIRAEAGPIGYLKTAAHGHADALAVEVRVGGIELLSDPGTFVYQGEPGWRDHFRSTKAHSTLELDGRSQAESAGAFLWVKHPTTTTLQVSGLYDGDIASWRALHDGYTRVEQKAIHERAVELHRADRIISVVDLVTCEGAVAARLTFQLGPDIDCRLAGSEAALSWYAGDGSPRHAEFRLPPELVWRAERGSEQPIEGWYSPSFGTRLPATVLIGEVILRAGATSLRSELHLGQVGNNEARPVAGQALDGGTS